MALIALTIAPALTVALTLISVNSQVMLTSPPTTEPAFTLVLSPDVRQMSMVGEMMRGPRGFSGDVASISADASNRLRLGTDAKLYVPDELSPDPLAYYILARD